MADGKPVELTISIGVATYAGTEADVTSLVLLSRADEALNEAKHCGRNRVVMAAHPTSAPVGAPIQRSLYGLIRWCEPHPHQQPAQRALIKFDACMMSTNDLTNDCQAETRAMTL